MEAKEREDEAAIAMRKRSMPKVSAVVGVVSCKTAIFFSTSSSSEQR